MTSVSTRVASRGSSLTVRAGQRVQSCADRLAGLILSAAALTVDVKTVQDWATATHVSVGSLRGYCHTLGIQPKHALDFTRLLRVVLASRDGSWEPGRWLAVSDPRHLQALLARGGLLQPEGAAPPTLETYLALQRLIPLQSGVLWHVAARLNGPNDK